MSDPIYLAPTRKVIAAAIAALIVGIAQQVFDYELFAGAEAAIAVLVAYLIPTPDKELEAGATRLAIKHRPY